MVYFKATMTIEVQNKDGRKIFSVDIGDMPQEEVIAYIEKRLGRKILEEENNDKR